MTMLEEAMAWNDRQSGGQFILLKDRVASSAAFLLNFFLKKILTSDEKSGAPKVVFFALSAPFSHYNRVCRKQGCNLETFRGSGDLMFIELFSDQSTWLRKEVQSSPSRVTSPKDQEDAYACNKIIMEIYHRLKDVARKQPSTCRAEEGKATFIIIDDLSLLELAAGGSTSHVLDFLHYCQVLSFNSKRCSMISLVHEDIYSTAPFLSFLNELQHAADVVISVEPLNTGYATDLHGQLTVVNRTIPPILNKMKEILRPMSHNMLFRLMESTVQFSTVGRQF